MTRLQIAIPGLLAMTLEKDDEPPPPSYDAEAEGADLDELSRVQLRPIAKAIPRGVYELTTKRRVAK